MSDDTGTVHIERRGTTTHITFDRKSARNTMTAAMYEQFAGALDLLDADPDTRVAVLRGAHGTFVAGTDIAQFTAFQSAEDGVAYERWLDQMVARLENTRVPTIAVIEGWAAGAGLILALACDLRICTRDARFGMPIARTVGNCLSIANTARLLAHLGPGRTANLLFAAGHITAQTALDIGLVVEAVEAARLDDTVTGLCEKVASHAPITMHVTRRAIRRILEANLPDGEDLVRLAYGSRDFHEGVAAFLAKRTPEWQGR